MQLHPTKSDAPLIVYLDFKSPYAYLAVEPTRQLERELNLSFDWRPFVLDIPSYLGSASLDETGGVAEQSRTSEQWAAVKYAYYDCRRYANIAGVTIRGTTKIWDTHLATAAMLWVREHQPEHVPALIDHIYQPFWKRELDIENPAAVRSILADIGINAVSCLEWINGEGLDSTRRFEEACFDHGIYGVPTYIIDDELYFGREHLPRVAWHLHGKQGPAPDIANPLSSNPELPACPDKRVAVQVDTSIDSLLAIKPLANMLDTLGLEAEWARSNSLSLEQLLPQDSANPRGKTHGQLRQLNQQRNIDRYAPGINEENLERLIQEELDRCGFSLTKTDQQQPSPFPGIVVNLDGEHFIGRQHLPVVEAILSQPS